MARRSNDVPQDPGYIPPDRRDLVYRRAENGELIAYTPEEYGVRKDDGLGLIKPVNSSAGLLVLAVLITIGFGGMLYGIVQMAITDQWEILGEIWWMYLLVLIPLLAGWSGYFKERKAEKLRKAHNLPRPAE
ncbi:hypothetical protein QFZ40_000878 [Arthrobacter pascens]|uniref:hypothetical protein n=1 Tax=Arthrobacter pascens TaxID=1677 RepID=UPI00278BA3A1|nr:hypothetical protein [Arthrobacter pascens]MDQ0632969.1 hypothetical protein [Arthrobacter pascens]